MVKSSLLGDRILNFVERRVERRVVSTEQVRGGCLSVVVRCRSRVLVASWVVPGCVRCDVDCTERCTAVVLRQRQGCDLRLAALCEARSRCLRTFVLSDRDVVPCISFLSHQCSPSSYASSGSSHVAPCTSS